MHLDDSVGNKQGIKALRKIEPHRNRGKNPKVGRDVEAAGARVLETMIATANGRLTRAEIFGDEEIAIARIQPTV